MNIVPIHPDDLEPANGDPAIESDQGLGVARRTAARRTLGRKPAPSRRTLGRKPAPSRRTLGRKPAPSRRTLMPRVRF